MAHRRGTFRRGISDSQRRKKTWEAFTSVTTDALGSSPSGIPSPTLNFETVLAVAAPPPQENAFAYTFPTEAGSIDPESTIMRIRGSLNMEKNSIVGVNNQVFAFGIAVLESTNLLAPAKFPNPANSEGAAWDGWMFYRSINSSIVDANATVVDVKAMRKVQSGYSLVFIAGSYASTSHDSDTAAGAINVQFTSRGLFLLP